MGSSANLSARAIKSAMTLLEYTMPSLQMTLRKMFSDSLSRKRSKAAKANFSQTITKESNRALSSSVKGSSRAARCKYKYPASLSGVRNGDTIMLVSWFCTIDFERSAESSSSWFHTTAFFSRFACFTAEIEMLTFSGLLK